MYLDFFNFRRREMNSGYLDFLGIFENFATLQFFLNFGMDLRFERDGEKKSGGGLRPKI